jgi:hypothetical protein
MRFKTLILLVFLFACSRGGGLPGKPVEVFGVILGGSMDEIVSIHTGKNLPLQHMENGSLASPATLAPIGSFHVTRVEYSGSAGILDQIEIHIEGDVESELAVFLDIEFDYNVPQRQAEEQKFRFIGTIGERDHYWLLPDIAIIVLGGDDETVLFFRQKKP